MLNDFWGIRDILESRVQSKYHKNPSKIDNKHTNSSKLLVSAAHQAPESVFWGGKYWHNIVKSTRIFQIYPFFKSTLHTIKVIITAIFFPCSPT